MHVSQDPTSSQGPLVTELPLGSATTGEGHAQPGVPNSAHSGPLNGHDQKSNEEEHNIMTNQMRNLVNIDDQE